MDRYVILESFGLDKVGIVSRLSEVLATSNCNIEDSRVSRLGQALTMMLLLKLPAGMDPNELLKRLDPVKSDLDLKISITELQPETVITELPPMPHASLTCHGADKIGIVHRITKFLADKSINIIDMHTSVLRRANPEYIMELTLEMHGYTDFDKLAEQTNELSKTLGIDIVLRQWGSWGNRRRGAREGVLPGLFFTV